VVELTCISFFRSNDGHILIISSSDGYCSAVSFEENELGIPLSKEETVEILAKYYSNKTKNEVSSSSTEIIDRSYPQSEPDEIRRVELHATANYHPFSENDIVETNAADMIIDTSMPMLETAVNT
jgi:hypothetical protein